MAVRKGTNATIIRDCVTLGYIPDAVGSAVLDVTWGLGKFWTLVHPAGLLGSDLDPAKSPTGTLVDFTALPYADGFARAVIFDPPYKLDPSPSASGPSYSNMNHKYGVIVGTSPAVLHPLICEGITECVRVLGKKGHLLVKCQAQINSGREYWQDREFADHAEAQGCKMVDRFDLVGHRPQPAGRRQLHARRNHSTLLVFKKL